MKILILLLLNVSSFAQMSAITVARQSGKGANPGPVPAQVLFATPQISPDITGLVIDGSGFNNTGKLNGAPCLTSAGAMVLNFTTLSGITVSSSEGTATITKSGNTLQIGAGTVYHITLSNGKIIPCAEGAGVRLYSSDVTWTASITGETASTIWTTNTQNTYFFSYANDVSRLLYFDGTVALSFQSSIGNLLTGFVSIVSRYVIDDIQTQDFAFKTNVVYVGAGTNKVIFSNNSNDGGGGTKVGWYLSISSGTSLTFVKATDNSTIETITSSAFSNINNGLKHEIGFTKNGTSVSFYIDGTLVNTTSLSSATIIYTTGSNSAMDTCIGGNKVGTSLNSTNFFSTGYLWNLQIGNYTTNNVTSITSQTDLNTSLAIWRMTRRALRNNVQVYNDEVSNWYLTPTATGKYAFTPFSANGNYGYPKGRFWADLGYSLDLTNGGANTSLSGKEAALLASDVRNQNSGNFKYYDNYEGNNVITYTTSLTQVQVDAKMVDVGYMPSDGIILVDERGQSNSEGTNGVSTDPASQYLAVQNAYIYSNTTPGNPPTTWQALQAKVNNEGNLVGANSSVSMNCSVAYASQSNIPTFPLRFMKYAYGGTTIYNQGLNNWSPNVTGQLVTLSNNYATSAINNIGISSSKVFLLSMNWIQGETDISYGNAHSIDIGTYYLNDLMTDAEKFLDNYIVLGVNTSKCVITIVVVQANNLLGGHPQFEDVKFALMKAGMTGLKKHPTLAGKCADIIFFPIDDQTQYPKVSSDPIHLSKIGQVNLGTDVYNGVLKNAIRTITPIN